MLSTLTSAYRAERAARPVRTPRTPLLVRVGRLAARVLPRAKQFRTATLSLTGFGLLTAAAWTITLWAGLAAAGISVLLLEYLAGDQ
jgi:hypothetical protein